ncbi:MAG TPA: family 16 glycosylhydrolase [Acidobacteriaceae bacterium]|nr:family 16 glycosylhydrolase [Acidobacteriaceae bacterium]
MITQKAESHTQKPASFTARAVVCTAVVAITIAAGCGAVSGNVGAVPARSGGRTAATPTFSTVAAQNGAVILTLQDSTSGAKIYYTTDGSTPNTSSIQYFAPFLVASNLTIKAIAAAKGYSNSTVASQAFSPNIASGTLVWSDEFSNSGSMNAQPNPATWTYDTGAGGWGNNELETYCAWGSNSSPCNSANPNAFVGTDGYLHIVAEQPTSGTYTSARMKTQGLFSFQYGRIEARLQIPESQGMWPAFWMLGNNITTLSWPACGESDIMEHIDGSVPPNPNLGYDWYQASVHGTNLNGGSPYGNSTFSAATWHTYGMIWTKGQVQFYIDDPSTPYETFNPGSISGTWPFDQGPMFVILNLAVGGNWPGSPNATTVFPSTYLVDYVRIYTN